MGDAWCVNSSPLLVQRRSRSTFLYHTRSCSPRRISMLLQTSWEQSLFAHSPCPMDVKIVPMDVKIALIDTKSFFWTRFEYLVTNCRISGKNLLYFPFKIP